MTSKVYRAGKSTWSYWNDARTIRELRIAAAGHQPTTALCNALIAALLAPVMSSYSPRFTAVLPLRNGDAPPVCRGYGPTLTRIIRAVQNDDHRRKEDVVSLANLLLASLEEENGN